jgi:hypothetical protein
MKLKIKYGKKEDKDKVIKKIQKDLGITLVAKKADDTVNGYYSTNESGEDLVIDVVLYDYDKDPDYEVYTYNDTTYSRGSKITIRKKDINKEKVKDLGAKAYDII